MIYCLDTSALINPWNKNYRIANFPAFWEDIDGLIRTGAAIAPMEVLKEIERQDDELLLWVRQRLELFREIDEKIEIVLRKEVLAKFHNMVDYNRDRSGADPWVVALALVENAVVVSQEDKGKKKRPSIPDVCFKLNVRHIRVADLIADQGWVYQR